MKTKFHLSLNVRDLGRAVEFYGRLFGMPPTKLMPDYAKFELSDPPLVLALEPSGQSGLNHLGIRYDEGEGLKNAGVRAHTNGLEPQLLEGIECCYSRQTKFCVTDPDGHLFEHYTLDAELDHAPKAVAAKAPEKSESIREHLLGTPFPETMPAGADSVRLRGTLNLRLSSDQTRKILKTAFDALKPGGELQVHLLASDREITSKLPKLPGPAANVEYTPTESGVLESLEEAGFEGLWLKRLSHSPVFQFDGARMRELLVHAVKPLAPAAKSPPTFAVYRGPLREVVDEEGNRFPRGARVAIDERSVQWLRAVGQEVNFVFLNEPSSGESECVAPRPCERV